MMKPAWKVSMKRLCTDSDRSSLAMSTARMRISQLLGNASSTGNARHLQEAIQLLAWY